MQERGIVTPKEAFTAIFDKSSSTYLTLLGLFALLFVIAIASGLHAMIIGYHHAYGVTREIPWGILISTYVFFAITSTGLCLISAIGHIFGVKNFDPIAKRAVFLSIVTLLAAFLTIFFDIENPHRMAVYNMLSPNLTSNIWWMGTLYSICLVFMLIEFFFIVKGDHKWAVTAGLIAVVSEIAANSTLGSVFAMIQGREYWYGPFMPIFFVTSAMMTGCAAVIFFTWLAYKLEKREMEAEMKTALGAVSKLGAVLVFAVMFFTFWKVITSLAGSPGKREVIMAFLSGPYSLNFWGFEVLLAMVLPFIFYLVAKGRDLNLMFVASTLMIVGLFVLRYDMVVYGEIVPGYLELGVQEYSELLPYKPSLHEIMIVTAGIGFTGMAFLLGEKIFKGHKVEHH